MSASKKQVHFLSTESVSISDNKNILTFYRKKVQCAQYKLYQTWSNQKIVLRISISNSTLPRKGIDKG